LREEVSTDGTLLESGHSTIEVATTKHSGRSSAGRANMARSTVTRANHISGVLSDSSNHVAVVNATLGGVGPSRIRNLARGQRTAGATCALTGGSELLTGPWVGGVFGTVLGLGAIAMRSTLHAAKRRRAARGSGIAAIGFCGVSASRI